MFQTIKSIDLHTHILPKMIPGFKEKFGYGGFIKLVEDNCTLKMCKDDGTFFRNIEQNAIDPQIRLNEMDKLDIEIQVLSTVPVMFSYWAKAKDTMIICEFLNNHIGKIIQEFPNRFKAFGTIPMQDTHLACMELERISTEFKFSGIQIGTNIEGMNLGDKNFWPIYELAQKLDMGIFIHPWNMMGEKEMQKYWLPWLIGMPAETARAAASLIFSGVLDNFPTLRIGLAHGGGNFPNILGRLEQGYNCRPDLCALDCKHSPKYYKNRFLLDSLVHEENQLKYLVQEFGAHSIALGSDYPFPLGEQNPGKLIRNSSHFSEDEKTWMLRKSAEKFLRMN